MTYDSNEYNDWEGQGMDVWLTRSEKAELIRTYCRTLENYMLEKLDHVPEEWNGLQLRNWFWMAAKEQYEHHLGRKEMKDIKNEIIVRNL